MEFIHNNVRTNRMLESYLTDGALVIYRHCVVDIWYKLKTNCRSIIAQVIIENPAW